VVTACKWATTVNTVWAPRPGARYDRACHRSHDEATQRSQDGELGRDGARRLGAVGTESKPVRWCLGLRAACSRNGEIDIPISM
jgi:hypothetical protein